MHPAGHLATALYNDRLRDAEQARLARSQKKEQETVVQLRRRGWVRALLGRRKVLAR
jgi:hypothetical protein